ncbi:DUF4279 domain-containing protein [Burkholderia multivorans]|uniref:DUF4279 domain-containing protein n=1 Tax=Burkholderia multivorans TaxID=87883 RepID=UPI0021C22E71|nr:DUF4279 domain-containing protein [Burkholderia multivorans]
MNAHQLAYASFTISGDDVAPEFWTAYFGVTPDTAVTKGRPFTTPTGKVSRVPGRTGVWGVRSKAVVNSDQLEPHLRYLIKRLGLPRADLRELIEKAGARVRFFCYWDNETGDRVPYVPEDIRALMESLGGDVEIDEYR